MHITKHRHKDIHTHTQKHTMTQFDSNINTVNQVLVLITENAQKLFHLQFLHKPMNLLDNI